MSSTEAMGLPCGRRVITCTAKKQHSRTAFDGTVLCSPLPGPGLFSVAGERQLLSNIGDVSGVSRWSGVPAWQELSSVCYRQLPPPASTPSNSKCLIFVANIVKVAAQ
jgi:hypothetical protein